MELDFELGCRFGASAYCSQIQTLNYVDQSYPNSIASPPVTSQSFYNLSSGTAYYFSVRALSANTQSSYSDSVTGTAWGTQVIQPPSVLSARTNGLIDLTWGAVPGASAYTVWSGPSHSNKRHYGVTTGLSYFSIHLILMKFI